GPGAGAGAPAEPRRPPAARIVPVPGSDRGSAGTRPGRMGGVDRSEAGSPRAPCARHLPAAPAGGRALVRGRAPGGRGFLPVHGEVGNPGRALGPVATVVEAPSAGRVRSREGRGVVPRVRAVARPPTDARTSRAPRDRRGRDLPGPAGRMRSGRVRRL